MNEREKDVYGKSIWFWLFICSTLLFILFAFSFCTPIYKQKWINQQGTPHLEKPFNHGAGHIYNRDENSQEGYKEGTEPTDLKKKTSNFVVRWPSNKYVVTKPVTVNELALRWHVTAQDIYKHNEWLEPISPSDPISPSTPVDKGNEQVDGKPVVDIPPSNDLSDYEKQVLTLLNKVRKENGLSQLKSDYSNLNKSAQAKSQDMAGANGQEYFSHTSPTYGDPFSMMKTFGVTFSSAAENIAQGQTTPQEVMDAWMNSEGHRRNILDGHMTHVGIGFQKANKQGQAKYYWTQQFVQK